MSTPIPSTPDFRSSLPCKPLACYPDRLGFAIDFLHGRPPFYGSVSRNEATVHLRFVHQPPYVHDALE